MFDFNPKKLKSSLSLGRPPKIQKIFLLFFSACFVESKLVALESFIKDIFFFVRNFSFLCGNPLKLFIASRKIFSLILNSLEI